MRTCVIACLLLVACSGESIPKNVLPPGKMQNVMYDVMRADEMVEVLRMMDSSYQPFAKRTALYDTVFGVHNVTKQRFQQSLTYYQGRPDLLKEMINNIHSRINDTTHNGTTLPKEGVPKESAY